MSGLNLETENRGIIAERWRVATGADEARIDGNNNLFLTRRPREALNISDESDSYSILIKEINMAIATGPSQHLSTGESSTIETSSQSYEKGKIRQKVDYYSTFTGADLEKPENEAVYTALLDTYTRGFQLPPFEEQYLRDYPEAGKARLKDQLSHDSLIVMGGISGESSVVPSFFCAHITQGHFAIPSLLNSMKKYLNVSRPHNNALAMDIREMTEGLPGYVKSSIAKGEQMADISECVVLPEYSGETIIHMSNSLSKTLNQRIQRIKGQQDITCFAWTVVSPGKGIHAFADALGWDVIGEISGVHAPEVIIEGKVKLLQEYNRSLTLRLYSFKLSQLERASSDGRSSLVREALAVAIEKHDIQRFMAVVGKTFKTSIKQIGRSISNLATLIKVDPDELRQTISNFIEV